MNKLSKQFGVTFHYGNGNKFQPPRNKMNRLYFTNINQHFIAAVENKTFGKGSHDKDILNK